MTDSYWFQRRIWQAEEKMHDYDVMRFSDGNGELYMSNFRSASWKWMKPGYTEIHLEDRFSAHDGVIEQSEKAESICRIWIEEGRIAHFSPGLIKV